MSLDRAPDAEPVSSIEELVSYFRSAERPVSSFQIGLEHEKLVYPVRSVEPVPYAGPAGIEALMENLRPGGYAAFRESPGQPVIALTRGQSTISLEPGGQLELSGKPGLTARQAHQENLGHLAEVKQACSRLGLRLVALGYRPFGEVAQMPWMPKTRYQVMRETLSQRGRLALDMMLMTATGQVSLDWSDEADCVRKAMLVARLSPLMVALFANSPLVKGRPSGLMSYRSQVWTEVDPARCGYLPSMFDGSFSYRAYVEWALDAPLLFLRRNGGYLQPRMSFRELLKSGFEGQPAYQSDWVDHLSTLFPEVRLKKVIEVRAADCASPEMTGGLAALWRGLLYDPSALADAEQLLPKVTHRQQLDLHASAREKALRARSGGRTLGEIAVEMVSIAREGLKRLDSEDAPLLDPLAEVAASGRCPAEAVLDAWKAHPDPVQLLDRFTL